MTGEGEAEGGPRGEGSLGGRGEGGPEGDLSGRLLVAGPRLSDPNFVRTVVLVLHHDRAGSLGVVVNRPSPMELAEPFPQWTDLAADPAVVFFGGPVGAGSAICLARLARPGGPASGPPEPPGRPGRSEQPGQPGRADSPGRPGQPGHADQGSGSGEFVEPGGGSDPPEGWRPVVGPVGTLDLAGDPAAARPHLDRLRVFSGYAGWGPGQLAGELRLGGWLLADPRPDDAFSDHPDELWSAVLRRQRGSLAMLARFPLDLSQN